MDDWKDDWENDLSNETPSSGILGQTLRNVTILAVICLVALLVFTQSGSGGKRQPVAEPEKVGQRQLSPTQTANFVSGNQDQLSIPVGSHNQFFVEAEVNGVPVQFMVDTGASFVSLSAADAERVGFNLRSLDYSQRLNTANGVIKVARVNLDTVQIGALEVSDVQGTAQTAGMSTHSLLGMSFLSRLESYEVRAGNMVLSW